MPASVLGILQRSACGGSLIADLVVHLGVVQAFINRVLVGVVEIEKTANTPAGRSTAHFVAVSRVMVPAVVPVPNTAVEPNDSDRRVVGPFGECDTGR